jgi:hypothetical protein
MAGLVGEQYGEEACLVLGVRWIEEYLVIPVVGVALPIGELNFPAIGFQFLPLFPEGGALVQ